MVAYAGGEDILPGDAPGDAVGDETGFAFEETFEIDAPHGRLRRTGRLLLGLIIVGAASGILIIVIVRSLAILWPKIFPSS